jgi:Protein of unknown function (DUF3159)
VSSEEIPDLKDDLPAERALLERAIGGWRGMIDSALPSLVFLITYLVTGSDLRTALIAAVAVGAVVAVIRVVRHQSLQQVLAGFAGVAISAFVASRTGSASDFYLPGILINAVYGAALLISILVGWPLIGVAAGYLTGDGTAWRSDPPTRRAYAAATWIWVGLFALRLLVQVPLYMAHNVAALGIAKVVMGWPLYLLAVYLTYRVLAPALSARRAQLAALSESAPE